MSKAKTAIKTQRELAAKLQRHESQVSRWIRRTDWPVRRRPDWSPADLVQIRAFMATLEIPNPEDLAGLDLSPLQLAKLEVLLERAATLKLDRLILEGNYRKQVDVERENVARIKTLMGGLMQLGRRLAPRIALVESEIEIEKMIEDELRPLGQAYAGGKS